MDRQHSLRRKQESKSSGLKIQRPEPYRNIVITGFREHEFLEGYSSWDLAKSVKTDEFEIEEYVNVVLQPIERSYRFMDQVTVALWENFSPVLGVHLGLHENPGVDEISIQASSSKQGYTVMDDEGRVPEGTMCPIGNKCLAECALDVQRLTSIKDINIPVKVANEAQFMLKYIAFISFSIKPNRTLVMHIPHPDAGIPVEEVKKAVRLIVQEAINSVAPSPAKSEGAGDSGF